MIPHLRGGIDVLASPYSYEGFAEAMNACNATIRAVAKELDSTCIDIAPSLRLRPELFVDLIHYNAEGNAAIVVAIEEQVCAKIKGS